MKQRLEPSDLAQLTDKQKDRLRELWQPEKRDFVLCNDTREVIVSRCDSDKIYLFIYGGYILEVKHCLPLLSIGQMIEILKEKRIIMWQGWGNHLSLWNVEKLILNSDKAFELVGKGGELCDALWQAVKEIL